MANTALVPVFTGNLSDASVQLCDARTLHTFMLVLRDFSNWIKGRIRKFGFVEGVDYLVAKSGENLTGRPSLDYHLTLDMAKELAMVENNEQGRAARRYFIDCERRVLEQAASSLSLPTATSPRRWLLQITDGGRPETAALADDAPVLTWAEIVRELRCHPESVPRDLVLDLAEAATHAAFSLAANLPRGEGATIADAIARAGDALSLADLQAIASAATLQSWVRARKHRDAAADAPGSIAALVPRKTVQTALDVNA